MAKKRYLVTGVLPVNGTQPGEEFEAELSEEQERSLIEGGAIKPAKSKPKEK